MISTMRFMRILSTVALLTLSVACGTPTDPIPDPLDVPFSTFDITVGTGTEAVAGKTIRVYYTGWVYSTTATDNKGSQFQTVSTGPGLSFTVGVGQVIRGWDQGMPGMKVGGKRRIIIPTDLAYGLTPPSGSGIPQNATLIFEVELLSVAG
jgi:FKBP-type peptidyl-prolyl cis-trans isomerase FkpA